MTGLRVLHVGLETPEARPGGLNSYVFEICSALRRAGSETRAIVVGDDDGATIGGVFVGRSSVGENSIFEVVDRPSSILPVRLLRYWLAVHRERDRMDVLDVHFALPALLPLLVGRLRVPVVMHFHGPWAEESSMQGTGAVICWLKRRIEGAVYRRCDSLVVLSSSFKTLLVERYGVDPDAVSVVPPGVDLERFSPGDRRSARETFGVPEQMWVVAVARRLVPRMGLDVLIRAWSKLDTTERARAMVETSDDNARSSVLLIAGEGAQRAELEVLSEQLGVTASVRFVGRVSDEDLVELYRAADASVVPSLDLEGFGFVVLESLACGTPVIASRTGGLPEAMDGLGDDLLVAPGNVAALAARLETGRSGAVPLPAASAVETTPRSSPGMRLRRPT